MTANDLDQASDCARMTMELLPVLRRWVAARVQWAGADSDLSLRQFAALRGIAEGASSPGELARLWQVTPAVITGIVDRLERRGLVRREPVPEDRRRLCLALTSTGQQASEAVAWALTGDLAAQLATATPNEWRSSAVPSNCCSGHSPRSTSEHRRRRHPCPRRAPGLGRGPTSDNAEISGRYSATRPVAAGAKSDVAPVAP